LPPLAGGHSSGVGGLDYVAIATWVILILIALFMLYSLNRSACEIREKIGEMEKDLETLAGESERMNALLKEV